MRRVVALLRGVNVGGHNKVPMARLRECAAAWGLGRPRTVLASGNLACDADAPLPDVRAVLEAGVGEEFGYAALVLVLEQEALAATVAEFPFATAEDRHDYVLFFDDGAVRDRALREAQENGEGPVAAGGDRPGGLPCVFWQAPAGTTVRGGLGVLFARPRYASRSTNRNLQTLAKLSAA